jgi:hypothetical protein
MRIPPIKGGAYKAATVFTVSENILRRNISIYLVARDGQQYRVVALADGLEKDLNSLLI